MPDKSYKHVNYLWDKKSSIPCANDIDLFLYRSNLLGRDHRITNFGGGNTSCKTYEIDPIDSSLVEVLWVKGSGGDIGTLTRSGIAGLYVKKIKALKKHYKDLTDEDRMVGLLNHCIFDLNSKTPSIDTALHGLLPYKHIDHLHPDAVIGVAASKDGESLTKDIWGAEVGWLPWQRPGFDLALKLERYIEEHPNLRGIVLGGHGLFTWGETSHECYCNSLEVIEKASAFIAEKLKKAPQFGGQSIKSLPPQTRSKHAAKLMPVLRGLCSSDKHMIGHFEDDEKVMEFVNSKDLKKLADMGTSCPDHFLRTKIRPLVINLKSDCDLDDSEALRNLLKKDFNAYKKSYKNYYDHYKNENSPPMRDANPVIVLVPGMGLFSFAKNKQTARVASEFYVNAINVMRGAEAISQYIPLPPHEAFNIEYWELEEQKLRRQPEEKVFDRKIALVTGAGGGIGRAIAQKLAAHGAHVILTDIDVERVRKIAEDLDDERITYGKCDVRDPSSIKKALLKTLLIYGGIDIVVHSAGLAISKPLDKTDETDWNILQEVLVKGQFQLCKQTAAIMKKQGLGGNIVCISSKNGLVSGANNIAYGTAKAGQIHMARLLAVELGRSGIRVNTVNPDGVIIGSKIWEGKWAKERAKSHGIPLEDLPGFYASRNLLNKIIQPEDIANAVYSLVALLDKTTGAIVNVDGGLAEAFVR